MTKLEIIEAMSIQVFNEQIKKFVESHIVVGLHIHISQSNECHGYILYCDDVRLSSGGISDNITPNFTGGNSDDVKCEICGTKGWRHKSGCSQNKSTGGAISQGVI